MQFQLLQSGDGRRAVLAQGDIVDGDAQRLASGALRRVTRDRHGTKTLLLDSPGGGGGRGDGHGRRDARAGVTTVVPAHGFCASACASVLFVAGKYRTIEATGAARHPLLLRQSQWTEDG